MAKWDHLIEAEMPSYGGWDADGELPGSNSYFENNTEFEMIAQQVVNPLRCLLGSVSRSTGPKHRLEIDHIIEEMAGIEKAIYKNANFTHFIRYLTDGTYKGDKAKKSIANINKVAPKMQKHGEAMLAKHKTFFPDDPLVTELVNHAYSLLVTYCKVLLRSIKYFPDRVSNPYKDAALQKTVKDLRKSVSKLLKRLGYKRKRLAPKRKRQKPKRFIQPVKKVNSKPLTPKEQKVIDDIIDLL